jgi:hypothetical protein
MRKITSMLVIAGTAAVISSCIDNTTRYFYEAPNGDTYSATLWTEKNSKTNKEDSVMTFSYIGHKDILGETMTDTLLTKKYNPDSKKYEITKIQVTYGPDILMAFDVYARKDTAENKSQELFLNAEKSWTKYLNKINEQKEE